MSKKKILGRIKKLAAQNRQISPLKNLFKENIDVSNNKKEIKIIQFKKHKTKE
jgi:hypothetical protein